MEEEIQTLQNTAELAQEIIVNYGFQFLAAIFILLIGWQLARWISSLVLRLCERVDLDITLSRFFAGLTKTIILVFVGIIALNKFGISIAPFIAALGAVVFGSTLALQGPISNYGAGLTIILTRPFIVGDTIRVDNKIGVVEEIKLAYTMLTNEDEEHIMIPNNRIIGQVITNSFEYLIVEESITLAYDENIEQAINLIRETMTSMNLLAKGPEPQVGVDGFAEYGIQIGIRYWVPTKQYFQLKYQVNQNIYLAIKEAGFTFPYPTQTIQLQQDK